MNSRYLLAIGIGIAAVSGPVFGAEDAVAAADRLVALVEALRDAPESLAAVRQTAEAVATQRSKVVLAADAERAAFFERRVLAVLQDNCVECHGSETQKSGLRVDSLAGLLKGGERGPAIVPGDGEASRLIQAVRREGELKMPPEEHPALGERDAWALAEWVRLGAHWPGQARRAAHTLVARASDGDAVSDAASGNASQATDVSPASARGDDAVLTQAVSEPASAQTAKAGESTIHFDRDIRPILSNHCFACHGPDEQTREAGLRLDDENAIFKALESGAVPVVAGDPEASALYQKITAADADDRMPPVEFEKPLSEQQIALLKQWIAEGAEWEQHWSFIPPERPAPPAVSTESWAKNPIDQFVLAKLEDEGLEPSPEADRATLLRRVTYDLTGLPPAPEEVEAFEQDTAPDAYERAVDRLLKSPRYGEHMARYWLDLARYADTNGYHIDNERYMWRWRDWVIQAFNENKPYDEFTVEQLAGDLLPDPTLEQKIATGFNRNHMINFEGGAIPEEYHAAYVVDRVDTTSTVWLGLTTKCAQCHDHKYDPISQREFYQMYALFNTVPEEGLDGRDGNSKPFLKAPLPEQEAEIAALEKEVASLKTELSAPNAETDAAQAKWEADWAAQLEEKWAVLTPQSAESAEGATLTVQPDASVLASGENPAEDTYTVVAPAGGMGITAVRLEALTDPSLPHGATGRSDNGNFVLTDVELEIASPSAPDDWEKVDLIAAQADFSQTDFPVGLAIDNSVRTGWAVDGQNRREDRTALFITSRPVGFPDGTLLKATLRFRSKFGQHSIGRLRLSIARDTALASITHGDWYINGPYIAESGDDAYRTTYEPEADIDLDSTYADGRAKWVRVLPGFEDGKLHALPGQVAATYLYRKISAPTAREAVLSVGSNDAIKVWLNGEVVHDNNVQRQAELDQDSIRVQLQEGQNDLLLKVVNYGNAYHFAYRVAEQQFGVMPLEIEALLAKGPEARSEADTETLRLHYRTNHVDTYRDMSAKLAEAEAALQKAEEEAPTTMVMAEMAEPRETHILMRGEYDKPGEAVEPGTPSALPPMADDAPRDRLGFARWLVSPEHPLTARVTVNRLWQQCFGTGLVKSSEDFGAQGDRPSHPELLDWLAVEFVESGWDVQHMLRLIVTSATYRQDSRYTPELRDIDPQNRLLARGPRLRLDAEEIRDTALAASGLLVEKLGGPSVKPYQPDGIWEEVAYGAGYSAQIFELGKRDELYRRSLYTFWKRQAPPPNMMVFDAPNRETCTARRARTNTPLQALNLLNGTQFVEAARALAVRVIDEGGPAVEDKLAYAYRLATSQAPSGRERAALRALLGAQRETFAQDEDAAKAFLSVGEWEAPASCEPAELAAWTAVASVLLNLDETITTS